MPGLKTRQDDVKLAFYILEQATANMHNFKCKACPYDSNGRCTTSKDCQDILPEVFTNLRKLAFSLVFLKEDGTHDEGREIPLEHLKLPLESIRDE